MSILETLHGGILVSCQALESEPLHGPLLMAGMALAAKEGGAVGLRANGCRDVALCRSMTQLPTIGIDKRVDPDKGLCITPTWDSAKPLQAAGADIIAVDARNPRPHGEDLSSLIPKIQDELGLLVMADCQTLADAHAALQAGANIIGSTFAFQPDPYGVRPDFDLLRELTELGIPVFAEGGFWEPTQVEQAFAEGVWSVVIGSAITRPQDITRRFVRAAHNEKRV